MIAELVRVIQSTEPVGDPVDDGGRERLGVGVAVDGDLLDVGDAPELVLEDGPAAVGAGEQDAAAGDAAGQGLGQRLGAERVGDEVGPEAEPRQGLGRRRADRGELAGGPSARRSRPRASRRSRK